MKKNKWTSLVLYATNITVHTWVDRYLFTKGFYFRFKDGKFTIKDGVDQIVYETKTDDALDEAVQFVLSH